jgi:adenylylsulfate kinase
MLIVAMAGLPGTGKSTLARALSISLAAPLLDKDVLRAAKFAERVDYSREQDDLVVREMYEWIERMARAKSVECVIVDGRTFSQRYQIDELRELALRCGARLAIVECVCEPAVARVRLELDALSGAHVAANRNFELYTKLAAAADEIKGRKLVVDTAAEPLDALVKRCIAFVRVGT